MEALAEQRHSMLEILTHEVRQPLNNAQAALEEMTRTMPVTASGPVTASEAPGQPPEASGARSLISRTRGIIDEIVLALSNAIVGAGLIERRSKRALHPVDTAATLILAKGDCRLESQPRVEIDAPDGPLFVIGDPVLLRLAFRNLLENGLKYSKPSTPVLARLHVNEDRMGIALEVLNVPVGDFAPHERLFERSTRASSYAEGNGLGLFITREIALLHNGTITAETGPDGQARFELFLPL
jgi:signal transduction histidine kinase